MKNIYQKLLLISMSIGLFACTTKKENEVSKHVEQSISSVVTDSASIVSQLDDANKNLYRKYLHSTEGCIKNITNLRVLLKEYNKELEEHQNSSVASEKLFFEDVKAYNLKKKLKAHVSFILQSFPTNQTIREAALNVNPMDMSINSVKNSPTSWEYVNFKDVPVPAALTLLTQIEKDLLHLQEVINTEIKKNE